MKKQFLIPFLLFISASLYGQTPAHYFIGQETFSNTHVYTILETDDGTLYTGTDNGMYFYSNGEFKQVKNADQQEGKSLFSLVADGLGNVFCCNLSGQIFKVSKTELKLIATVPEKWRSKRIHLQVNRQNELLIITNIILKWQDQKLKPIKPLSAPSILNCPTGIVSDSIFYGSSQDSIFCFDGNDITGRKLTHHPTEYKRFNLNKTPKEQQPDYHSYLYFFEEKGQYLLHSGHGTGFIEYTDSKEHIRFKELMMDGDLSLFDQSTYIFLRKSRGFHFFYRKPDTVIVSDKLMPDQFISCFFKSKKGLLYLGTFDNGIIVIPTLSSRKVDLPDKVVPYSFTIRQDGSMYLVDRDAILLIRKLDN